MDKDTPGPPLPGVPQTNHQMKKIKFSMRNFFGLVLVHQRLSPPHPPCPQVCERYPDLVKTMVELMQSGMGSGPCWLS